MIDPSLFPTLEDLVGETPLMRLQRLGRDLPGLVLAKLEGNNPAG
ncbi:MAG TPA: cysteine synthase B, partial [Plasticicumulans sp.]|nr:cysteine synthase B [Plasticicumulans sp.]